MLSIIVCSVCTQSITASYLVFFKSKIIFQDVGDHNIIKYITLDQSFSLDTIIHGLPTWLIRLASHCSILCDWYWIMTIRI